MRSFSRQALLHREHPDRADFTLSEIVKRAEKENLHGELRPGVHVHASLHCVANRAPNPGRYRMLYATSDRTRRLLAREDDVHPQRTGKMFPDPEEVPQQYHELILWAKRRFGGSRNPPTSSRWLDGIFQMIGMGREMWKGEDPDAYVERQRENWE